MQYTEQQLTAFRAEFARRRRRQIIASVPAAIVAIALVIAKDPARAAALGLRVTAVLPAALGVVFGVLLFSVRNWRCPACDGYLGRSLGPRFCQKCGVALR